MASARATAARLLSLGVLTAGWDAVLTGVALLLVAVGLGSVSGDDGVAPPVAIVLAVTGLWQLERGVLAELRRPGHEPA